MEEVGEVVGVWGAERKKEFEKEIDARPPFGPDLYSVSKHTPVILCSLVYTSIGYKAERKKQPL